MSVESLLSKLEGVRETGQGQWLARCPSHDDRSPSLSVRAGDNGAVLIHCFAGCAPGEVLAAVGMEFGDLYPDRQVAPFRLSAEQERKRLFLIAVRRFRSDTDWGKLLAHREKLKRTGFGAEVIRLFGSDPQRRVQQEVEE